MHYREALEAQEVEMAITVTLKKGAASIGSEDAGTYRSLGEIVGRFMSGGKLMKSDTPDTYTITFGAGTVTCGTCGKARSAPGTITIN
jgi:hypothetical protein